MIGRISGATTDLSAFTIQWENGEDEYVDVENIPGITGLDCLKHRDRGMAYRDEDGKLHLVPSWVDIPANLRIGMNHVSFSGGSVGALGRSTCPHCGKGVRAIVHSEAAADQHNQPRNGNERSPTDPRVNYRSSAVSGLSEKSSFGVLTKAQLRETIAVYRG